MATNNFNSKMNPAGSKFKYDRVNLVDSTISTELDTYAWDSFRTLIEPLKKTVTNKKGEVTGVENDKMPEVWGKKSLFNNIHAVGANTKAQLLNNMPLYDTTSNRAAMRAHSDCSIKELVRASGNNEMGRAVYSYADFMYCKHLGKCANNQLITLRRFPFPCGDHINYIDYTNSSEQELQQHMPDCARLVSWMGVDGNSLEEIMKYSVKMPYKPLTANIQENANEGDTAPSPLGSLFAASDSTYSAQVLQGTAGAQAGYFDTLLKGLPGSTQAPYANAQWQSNYDQNKTYGPIDVIKSTHIRSDEGLQFDQNIKVTFNYELRSYAGINGKMAFMDLLSNVLACTYTTGKFWGGAIKSYGAHQNNLYANLPIFNMDKNATGNPLTNTLDALFDSMTKVTEEFTKDGLEGLVSTLSTNLGSMLVGKVLNSLGRPHKTALNSLLNPAPTGLWHLTIGNPKVPMLSIGNLIIEGTDIQHYGPLGIDDFPTGLKVEVTLKHAKPRDITLIEQMYTQGDNRIYSPMGDQISKMYDNAGKYKSSTSYYSGSAETTADSPDKETSDVSSSENSKYIKFFGTSNITMITKSSQEAFFGSDKLGKKSTTT